MWDNLSIKDKAKYIEFAVKNGYKDLDIIKDAYNKFANGGPKDENSINPKWNSENYYSILGVETPFVDISRGAQKSQNFVTAYYNSPGFGERLSKHINTTAGYTDKYGSAPVQDITKPNKIKFPKVKEKVSDQGSYYDPTSNTIFIDKEQLAGQKYSVEDIGVFNTEQITSHEFGHSLDSQMNVSSPAILDYSLTYPQLRKFSNSNSEDTEHDKRPSEIYADLIAMRDMLYRSGIFNSLKQTSKNPFTKKHLKTFKKVNPNFRMFNNFTDDEIVNLMNTIAYNPIYNTEYTNYAAYGGNLFETGGPKEGTKKVGPTYNPETKRWTNYKGQDITGKSFKGKYGTTTYLNSGAVDLDASKVSGKDNDHHWRYASNAPRVYIGGDTNEARQKYYEKDIELTNTIKQMAKQYGISPNVLASRIADEGPIDDNIRHYNNSNGYIRRGDMVGPAWGLDDLGTMIYEGTIKLRPELRKQINTDYEFENEHGRTTYSVDSKNFLDGVELTAVALKYFKDEMRKRYPKATEEQLEQYATAAFNNGLTGTTNLINKGRLKEAYKPYINIKGDGGFINPYPAGHRYTESPECAYFSNHTLNDQGYMMSGNAWTPRGGDIIFNGFDGLEKPDTYDEATYNKYALDAADNVFNDFNTRETLDPNKVYTVNMYHASSRKKERAFNEGDSVYGTHTGYLNYEPEDDTWYVTHNIDGVVHKDRFGDLQRKGNSNRVTAIFEPRKNTVLNRALTWLGFANGGMLNIIPSPEDID